MKYHSITRKIIGCAFLVYNKMGFEFLESVYEKCLTIELNRQGLRIKNQVPIIVYYDAEVVGEFVADILVEDRILVELKSVRRLTTMHELQLVNYLVASKIDVGLLINFGEDKVEVRRKLRLLNIAS